MFLVAFTSSSRSKKWPWAAEATKAPLEKERQDQDDKEDVVSDHPHENRELEKSIMKEMMLIMAGLSAMAGVFLTVVVTTG